MANENNIKLNILFDLKNSLPNQFLFDEEKSEMLFSIFANVINVKDPINDEMKIIHVSKKQKNVYKFNFYTW